MNAHMLSHYSKVARKMNNYVAASAQDYYQNQYYQFVYDKENVLNMNGRPSLMNSGLGNFMAYGLHAVGLPSRIVNLAYRVGSFFDIYA